MKTKEKLYEEFKQKTVKQIIKELEERGEVLNCLSDRVFKSLFSNESLKGVLSYIIVYVTDLTKEEVYDNIEIVNPYEPVNNITEREKTHDLKVNIENSTITLEMNKFNDSENKFRNAAHYHESIVKKLQRAKSKKDIGKVYQISFDVKNPLSESLISIIMMMDIKTHLIDPSESNFKKYLINVSKITKMGYNVNKLSRFEKILLMLSETKKESLRKIAKGDKELEDMEKEIERLSKDPETVSYINDETLRKIAYEIDMENAEKKGHSSGYTEGHSSGYTEGHSSGYSEGIHENSKDIAKKMLDKKMNIKDISDVTGMSIDEIKKLVS